MPGNSPYPRLFLPFPRFIPASATPSQQDAPLVESQPPRSRCNSTATASEGRRSAWTISWGTLMVTSDIFNNIGRSKFRMGSDKEVGVIGHDFLSVQDEPLVLSD